MVSIAVMFVLYASVSHYNADKRGLSNIVQGAQSFRSAASCKFFFRSRVSRRMHGWRPSVVCISGRLVRASRRVRPVLRWIAHRYGFGTFIHYIEGHLSRATHERASVALERLVELAHYSGSNVYVDTIVSPSYRTAICQLIQLPGVSGQENNTVLFEFSKSAPGRRSTISCTTTSSSLRPASTCVSWRAPSAASGTARKSSIVLSPSDFENANLMILLAYILLGHPDWKDATIRISLDHPRR